LQIIKEVMGHSLGGSGNGVYTPAIFILMVLEGNCSNWHRRNLWEKIFTNWTRFHDWSSATGNVVIKIVIEFL
jgi:hypothetical protein